MTPPSLPQLPVVLYDGDCSLCRSLAAWLRPRAREGLSFCAWQTERPGETPHSLGLVSASGELVVGPAAWSALLALHPDFKGLQWVAERLGLEASVGKALSGGGNVLRRLCFRCGRAARP